LQAEKEIQNLQLRQKSILNYILIGSAVSLAIISLLSYRNYKSRQKLQQQRITELETEKQLTATEAILKGEEKERSRLAQDLHDGLGGMLSGIKYSLNNMKENLIMTPGDAQAFEHSINMLDNSISEMRRVAHNLMPENLLKFGLAAAIQDYCSEIQLNGMLQVHSQYIGLKDKAIDQSLSVTVYRITQELLNNVIKHAGATQAIVQIGVTESQLTITAEDNGKGLADEAIKTATGIGWKNIYSRVNYHKGSISIQSQPDKGTSVFIEFPLI
jgi:signal transduction histidine kinase